MGPPWLSVVNHGLHARAEGGKSGLWTTQQGQRVPLDPAVHLGELTSHLHDPLMVGHSFLRSE